jgi:tRNA pseudouridine38-40 synthase
MSLHRVRAIVEYDGTEYQGFQVQPSAPTIQGMLEQGLAAVTHDGLRVAGAGRTDAGVHAKGQVVHFDTEWRHGPAVLGRAWNANLPSDIVVKELEDVSLEFHARFSAKSREYRYSFYVGSDASPLVGRYAHHLASPVAVGAMAEGARHLCGEHDFAAFGKPPSGTNTVRTVERAVFAQNKKSLQFTITGNAFLRRMVRLIVGTLLLVGMGRLAPEDIKVILSSKDSNHPVAAVPPKGLCLMRVNYAL